MQPLNNQVRLESFQICSGHTKLKETVDNRVDFSFQAVDFKPPSSWTKKDVLKVIAATIILPIGLLWVAKKSLVACCR